MAAVVAVGAGKSRPDHRIRLIETGPARGPFRFPGSAGGGGGGESPTVPGFSGDPREQAVELPQGHDADERFDGPTFLEDHQRGMLRTPKRLASSGLVSTSTL